MEQVASGWVPRNLDTAGDSFGARINGREDRITMLDDLRYLMPQRLVVQQMLVDISDAYRDGHITLPPGE
ncbi:hypothetical protein T484DRAFT_1843937, partial [Baffinella frigidus]